MCNWEKNLRITGTQGEKEHGDPMFLLQFLNVLFMAGNCVKFEENLNSRSFSRKLL